MRHDPVASVRSDIENAAEEVRDGVAAIVRGMQMLSAVPGSGVGVVDADRAQELADRLLAFAASAPPAADIPPQADSATQDEAGTPDGGPREGSAAGQVAMRQLLHQVIPQLPERESFTPKALMEAVEELPDFRAEDFLNPRKTLHNTLVFMHQRGEITRLGRGIYIAPRLQGANKESKYTTSVNDGGEETRTHDRWRRPPAA